MTTTRDPSADMPCAETLYLRLKEGVSQLIADLPRHQVHLVGILSEALGWRSVCNAISSYRALWGH